MAKYLVDFIKKSPSFKSNNYDLALQESFLALDKSMESVAAMKELWEFQNESNNQMINAGEQNYWEFCVAGCTSVVALIAGPMLYVGNAGDSRCVLSRAGTAIGMSIDHKPDLEAEKQRIQKAGGEVIDGRVNGNLNLSRALGDMEYKDAKLK